MSSATRVRVDDEGGVRRITLTRPEKQSAFDVAQAHALFSAIAEEIAANPPGAVRESKRLIELGRTASFEDATAAEDASLASRCGSEENVAAVMALMARKP